MSTSYLQRTSPVLGARSNPYKTVSGAEPHQLLCVTASCMASIVLPYNLRIWIRQAISQIIEFTLDWHCPQS
jgi:hypothetical protein